MIELKHKKLNVWKVSMGLTANIYTVTNTFPKSELYGLTSQLRRASVSVPSNIAEGSARSSAKERRRFYEISRSSLVEIDTQIEIALRLGYISTSDIERMEEQINHTFAMLSNLITNTQ
ncbi:MAG TPA: four helix bundle protein [Fodinibius sp.]|nr:four helix bundle protein [Fodinibius sp.]